MTSFCLVITFLDISLSFVWVNILLVASSVLFNHFYLSRQIKTHIPICLLMTWCLCVYWREGEISSNKKSVIVFWAEKLIWFTQVVLPLQESLCIIAQSDAVSVKLTLHGYNHLSHRLKRGRSETCLFTFTSYFLFPTWELFQKILLYNVNFSSYIWVDSELGLLCCFVFVESIRKGKEYSLKAPSPCLWHLRLPFHYPDNWPNYYVSVSQTYFSHVLSGFQGYIKSLFLSVGSPDLLHLLNILQKRIVYMSFVHSPLNYRRS